MLKIIFLRNLQALRVTNSRIIRIQNAKFSGCSFYVYTNMQGHFQICISLPLISNKKLLYCNWLATNNY